MISREHILSIDDRKTKSVFVPEWDIEVYVRVLCGKEFDDWELSLQSNNGSRLSNIRARFVALCTCDENGNRIFDDSDSGALGDKSASAINRIFQAGIELNKIGQDQIEEMEKNFESVTAAGSI